MTPIHICHISQSAGGVETYILNLLRNIDRNKFCHTVICYKNGTLARTAKEAGAEVIMIPMVREISPLRDLISFIRILLVIKKLKPKIIHSHSSKGGMFGRLCRTILGIPVAFTPHAFAYLGQQGIRRYLVMAIEKLFALTPSLLVASSPSEAKRAIEEIGWKPEKVTDHFPNSIEVQEKKVEHYPKEKVKVLSIGRLGYQKNPEMLLRVAAIVKAHNPSIIFNILGAGYGDELGNRVNKMIEDLQLDDVVSIKPWADSDVVERELLSSDIYVSTSRYESFGLATAEAMEKGLPVVATHIDGSVDLIEDGKNGYLVEVDEDQRMASYICNLAADSDLRRRLGESGRSRVEEFFNIKKNITAIESIYCSLYRRFN